MPASSPMGFAPQTLRPSKNIFQYEGSIIRLNSTLFKEHSVALAPPKKPFAPVKGFSVGKEIGMW
ncbi:MAG: hypothetical protein NTZ26_11290 [Candidatus Aminicenantes bacterium]|nr:hypothetical protein [Candidatus Aminicenantes bacterium]